MTIALTDLSSGPTGTSASPTARTIPAAVSTVAYLRRTRLPAVWGGHTCRLAPVPSTHPAGGPVVPQSAAMAFAACSCARSTRAPTLALNFSLRLQRRALDLGTPGLASHHSGQWSCRRTPPLGPCTGSVSDSCVRSQGWALRAGPLEATAHGCSGGASCRTPPWGPRNRCCLRRPPR